MRKASKPPCRKRNGKQVSFDFKLSVIEEINNGRISVNYASKKYNISRHTINYWMKKLSNYESKSKHVGKDEESEYDWEYVIKRVKKNKMNVAAGTREIISEIASIYVAEKQQMELIKFYKSAYDFKTVDKTILKNLIDSLTKKGSTMKLDH